MSNEVTIAVPGRDEPGYLRRLLTVTEFQENMAALDEEDVSAQAGLFRDLLDYLVQFVKVPKGEDPMEALLDLSQDQYEDVLSALAAGEEGPKDEK